MSMFVRLCPGGVLYMHYVIGFKIILFSMKDMACIFSSVTNDHNSVNYSKPT